MERITNSRGERAGDYGVAPFASTHIYNKLRGEIHGRRRYLDNRRTGSDAS
jgi:hypothetical protein